MADYAEILPSPPKQHPERSGPKKPKLTIEEEKEKVDIVSNRKYEASSEDDFEYEEDRVLFKKYIKQYIESDGFDMDPAPFKSGQVIGGIEPLDLEIEDHVSLGCIKAVKNAIAEKNRKGAQLEFVRVIKVNWHPGVSFYATIEAKDLSSSDGDIKVYQTLVHHTIRTEETEVEIFREKVPKPTNTEP